MLESEKVLFDCLACGSEHWCRIACDKLYQSVFFPVYSATICLLQCLFYFFPSWRKTFFFCWIDVVRSGASTECSLLLSLLVGCGPLSQPNLVAQELQRLAVEQSVTVRPRCGPKPCVFGAGVS